MTYFLQPVFSQKKSEKIIEYWLERKANDTDFYDNTPKDSCIMFWEEYNIHGKITKRYDFPADRCWQINGPWEHHYFYDVQQRLTEYRWYGGVEGDERILMENEFYSYPFLDTFYKTNVIRIIYDYKANTRIEQEQVDTFYFSTTNIKEEFNIYEIGLVRDTLSFLQGDFLFTKHFSYNKELFKPFIIKDLIGKKTIQEFDFALKNNIKELSHNLKNINQTSDNAFYEFSFQEINSQKIIEFDISEHFIKINLIFLNQYGDEELKYHYRYYIDGDELKKIALVKSFIEYF